MRLRLTVVFFLAIAVLYPAEAPDIDIAYQKFVLPNGLTLIVHEDRKAPIVAVNIWYHVGSKNERAGKTGFAHLFEHLMFGGSEHLKGSYIQNMERFGATNLNGTTSFDRTNYFQNVPTSALDFALYAEADRMGWLLSGFDKATLDQQRGVVQNEKRQGENQPYGRVFDVLFKNTYPAGHPYSWMVIGEMEDLKAASMEDVQQWFKTYYGPNNAVLVIAGDVNAATAKAKVEKYFGEIPPTPPVDKQRAWVAKMTGTHRMTMQDRVPQTRVLKSWNTPEWGHPESTLLDLASRVLSSGRSSRLQKRLVYDEQLATNVGSGVVDLEIGGKFMVQADLRPGVDPAKVEKALDEEMAKFLASGPTAAELERVKAREFASFIRGVERVGGFGGKSDILATGQVYGGSPAAYKQQLKEIAAATPAQLRDAAVKWLSDGQFVLEVQPYPQVKAGDEKVDRAKPPVPGPAPAAKLPAIQRTTLSNGLKIMLAERHEIPVVDFHLTFDAGYAADKPETQGAAALATALMREATKTRTGEQISEEAQTLGAILGGGCETDSTLLTLSALKTNLDPSLELFADVLLNPTFPQADFERDRKRMMAAVEREKSSPSSAAARLLPLFLFGKDHPYGRAGMGHGTAATLAKLQREDLVAFHENWLRPNNATLVVVGDTTLAEIRPKIDKLLGSWRATEVPKKSTPSMENPSQPVVYIVDKPGSPQSFIGGGFMAPGANNPREVAIGAMNHILGGSFGSRINMNLREGKHWSYGVRSSLQGGRNQRIYTFSAPVQSDKTAEAMTELRNEMLGITGKNPPSDAELTKTQENLTLRQAGNFESKSAVAAAMVRIEREGLPDDYFVRYPDRVKALRTADLTDAAKSLITPDRMVWVVVGDRTKIEAGIKALQIGQVKAIDADGKEL